MKNGGRSPVRVCFILPTRGITHGGLETIADHLAAGLAQRGHAVTFLMGAVPGWLRRRDLPHGVEPVVIPFLHRTSTALRVLARITRQKPLNLQSLGFFLISLANPRVRRALAQCDLAVTFVEGEAVLYSRFLAQRGIATIYYFSGGIDENWARRDHSLRIANARTTAAEALEKHQHETHAVITPGIDSALLQIPRHLNSGDRAYRLISVSRLVPIKHVERLLPIVQVLTREFPQLTLRLIGDGPSRPSLEREARARGIGEQVVFCGALPSARVYDELRQADLFLFPSSYETFGIAALEAMAAGVPVIASDLPALCEATGGHACHLPPDDTAAWAQSIRKLLLDPQRRDEMARAGREWAANFTWERIVDQFEAHVLEAVNSTDESLIARL